MEGFTFWKSYYETVKDADPEDVKTLIVAMGAYMFDDEEPNITGTASLLFKAFRPSLDKSKNRSISGKNGGKANESKSKQTRSKLKQTEANAKQNEANESKREALKTNNKKQITKNKEQTTNNVGGYGGMPSAPGTALDVFAEFAGENADLMSALRGFAEMRQKIKKPLTPRAAQMIVNGLTGITSDPGEQAAILDQSTVHGWQTVYPLHKTEKKTNGPVMQAVTPRPSNAWLDDIDPETGLPRAANDGN